MPASGGFAGVSRRLHGVTGRLSRMPRCFARVPRGFLGVPRSRAGVTRRFTRMSGRFAGVTVFGVTVFFLAWFGRRRDCRLFGRRFIAWSLSDDRRRRSYRRRRGAFAVAMVLCLRLLDRRGSRNRWRFWGWGL